MSFFVIQWRVKEYDVFQRGMRGGSPSKFFKQNWPLRRMLSAFHEKNVRRPPLLHETLETEV